MPPPPPPSLSARAPERRLAVLLSHFRPCREAPRATTRLASAERHGTEAEAEVSASPCAAAGSGEDQPSSRGHCVFCSIVAGAAPAFKVCFPNLFSRSLPVIAPLRGAFSACPGFLSVCAELGFQFSELLAPGRPIRGASNGRVRNGRVRSRQIKLYEDEECLCILDAKPLTAGHSLIIPKSHYPSLQTTPPAVLAAICSKLPLLGTAIMKATRCDAFNVLINNGEKAGQVVFHTHVHIVPRRKDDNLWSSETYSRNPISHGQDTKNLVSSIKEVLSSSPEDYSTVMSSTPKGFRNNSTRL